MKKIGLVLLFTAAFASPALAMQITVGYGTPGPGTIAARAGNSPSASIQACCQRAGILGPGDTGTRDIGVADTFQSFCLELSEPLYGLSTPWAAVSSSALEGGVVPGGDPLSVGTTYLYSQFAIGALGYSYSGAGRIGDARALQEAIWSLEGEMAYQAANPYIIMVEAMFGGRGRGAG